ncbi:hypothetical protein PYCC9005_001891 [Savitreella phatthalungensis]
MTYGPIVAKELRSVTQTATLIYQTKEKLRRCRDTSPVRAVQLTHLLDGLQARLREIASSAMEPPSYEDACHQRKRETYDLPEHYLRQDFAESDYAIADDEEEEDQVSSQSCAFDRDSVEEWQEYQQVNHSCGPVHTSVKHDDAITPSHRVFDEIDDGTMPLLTRQLSHSAASLGPDELFGHDMPPLTRSSSRSDSFASDSGDDDADDDDAIIVSSEAYPMPKRYDVAEYLPKLCCDSSLERLCDRDEANSLNTGAALNVAAAA